MVALMMGTHLRLGAESPLLMLDRDIAASIAQIIIADKWCAPCTWLHQFLCSTCVCEPSGRARGVHVSANMLLL